VKRRFRLTRSTDFKRVRRFGKSYAHPLLVLVTTNNEEQFSRVGITAGKSIGGAVQRNRAKRRIRAAVRSIQPEIAPGWDIMLIARPAVITADYSQLEKALKDLLLRANLLGIEYAGR
jgi:ribonuclease P protein component